MKCEPLIREDILARLIEIAGLPFEAMNSRTEQAIVRLSQEDAESLLSAIRAAAPCPICRGFGYYMRGQQRVPCWPDCGSSVDCREAIAGIADDYMTSEVHHPGYVLIPTERFERLVALPGAKS
jgi:hypothetical protein